MGKSSSQLSRDDDDGNSNRTKRKKATEGDGETVEMRRLRLSEVVLECNERWFQDTLKEAEAGEVNMQVLVSQMYHSGYGVPKDADKGKFWMTRASRMRSSVWKVRNKRPGYNASDSDSDSDDLTDDS